MTLSSSEFQTRSARSRSATKSDARTCRSSSHSSDRRERARALSSASSSYSTTSWSSAASNESLLRLRRNESAQVALEDQFCGWLWMRGSKIGRWRHRYFCLNATVLSYFSTFPCEEFLRQASPEHIQFSDGTPPRGVIRVAHVEEIGKEKLGFKVFGACGRSIEIRAHRVDERNEWLRALKIPARRKSRSWSAGSVEDLTLSLSSFDPDMTCSMDRHSVSVRKTGWLRKRSDVLKRWNRYFFVIQGKMLSYYASDKPYEVPRRRGYVYGVAVSRSSVGTNGFHPNLQIKLDNQSVHVRCNSEEELEEWLEILHECTVTRDALSPALLA